MPALSPVVVALKKCLAARGMTYAVLARKLGISEPTVKRMFSRGSLTLARFEQVLAALELGLHEFSKIGLGVRGVPVELTLEQEAGLARDSRLLSVFWIVVNGRRFDEILEDFAISKAELTLAYAALARLRLIDWGPGERARLRVPKDFAWRASGPVKRAYGLRVTGEFLKSRFDAPLELLRFENKDLSAESAAVLRRKLERLSAEFNELAEVDSTLPPRRHVSIGMLVACRPWEFSEVIALKKRKP